jgi:hypothetical protein
MRYRMYSVCPSGSVSLHVIHIRRGYPMIPISGIRVGLLYLANDLGVTPNLLRCSAYPCLAVLHSHPSENFPRWGYGAYIDIYQ